MTVIKDEKAKPAVVDNHVAKDVAANKEKPAEVPKTKEDSSKKKDSARKESTSDAK